MEMTIFNCHHFHNISIYTILKVNIINYCLVEETNIHLTQRNFSFENAMKRYVVQRMPMEGEV